MRPTDLFLDFLYGILCFRIYRDCRPELPRQRHLFRSQIHGCDVQSHSFCILNGNVAQATYS